MSGGILSRFNPRAKRRDLPGGSTMSSQQTEEGYHDRQAKLYKALAAAQGEFPSIEKNATVQITTKTGRVISFDYATLDAVLSATRPALSRHGLSIFHTLSISEDKAILRCVLAHEGGGTQESELSIPRPKEGEEKAFGAILTYLRRYQVSPILGVAPEDDIDEDESDLGQRQPQTQKPPVREPQPSGELIDAGEQINIGQKLTERNLTLAKALALAGLPEDRAATVDKLTKVDAQKIRKALL
jgi:hypothetical protein